MRDLARGGVGKQKTVCHLCLVVDDFLKYFRHVNYLLRRRGRSREDAEDLIQETFLRVKSYVDKGGEVREPEAFLVRTALNLSRDTLRDEHRQLYSRKPLEELLVPDLRPGPEDILESSQRLELLSRALNKAGPRAREILLMHRLNGMTYPQIADHFDISVSAVEKHVARAMAILGESLLEL